MSPKYPSLALASLLAMPALTYGVSVTTQHNDNYRTGANTQETLLNTSNVNVNTFGKLFTIQVTGVAAEGQILYVPQVNIPGKGTHNVIYHTTKGNTVFAFDADAPTAEPLWYVAIGQTGTTASDYGIYSTPVIDTASNTLYVVVKAYDGLASHFKLHALDISTGFEKPNSPVEIQGSVPGTGEGSIGGVLNFDPTLHIQRPGLLLLNNKVYIAFSSYGDRGAYHGWVFAYKTGTLEQDAVLSTSPDSSKSGIWQDGNGLVADTHGYIYLHTGNGLNNVNTGGASYGDSVVKIDTANGLDIVDYFSPKNREALSYYDIDIGSSGPLLIPGSSVGVGGGKEGILYVWDTNNMGQYNPVADQLLQFGQISTNELASFLAGNHQYLGIFGGNVYYDAATPTSGPQGRLFVWGKKDNLKSVDFKQGRFDEASFTVGPPILAARGGQMSLSSNGKTPGSAILWTYGRRVGALSTDPGILAAINAANIGQVLWSSNENPTRDVAGRAYRVPPTVANGKVYTTSLSGEITVYGLLP